MKTIQVSNDFVKSIILDNNQATLKVLFQCVFYNQIIKQNDENIYLSINLKDLKNVLKMDFKNLRLNMKLIQKTLITIKNPNKNIHSIQLIKKVSFLYEEQKMVIEIDNLIYKELHGIKDYFTIIDLDNLILLDNKHSIRLLTILERLDGFGEQYSKTETFTKEELNELFGTNYKSYKEIERSILIPTQKELNEYSKLSFVYNFDYDFMKETPGRKPIKNVKIILQENKTRQLKFNL